MNNLEYRVKSLTFSSKGQPNLKKATFIKNYNFLEEIEALNIKKKKTYIKQGQFYFFPYPFEVYPFLNHCYSYNQLPFWLHKNFSFFFQNNRYCLQISSYFYGINFIPFFIFFFFISFFFFKDIYILYDSLPSNPYSLRYDWNELFLQKEGFFYYNFLKSNAIKYELNLDPYSNVLKFSQKFFFIETNFLYNTAFCKFFNDNSVFFSFSGVYFFNVLQTIDFSFLHKDFYSFYPIIKFIFLRNILLSKFNLKDLFILRNYFVMGDDSFFNQEIMQIDVTLLEAIYSDSFYQNVNTKNLINQFFSSFKKEEIYDRTFDELSSFFYKDFYKEFFCQIDPFYQKNFYFSLNKSFNGILEMLHLNSKISFPKRFILLSTSFFDKNNIDKKGLLFWSFWKLPRNFLNSKFFFFKDNDFSLNIFFKHLNLNSFSWIFNLKIFDNFFLLHSNFNNNFFWTSFLDLNDFCFDYFSYSTKYNKTIVLKSSRLLNSSFKKYIFKYFRSISLFSESLFFFPFICSLFFQKISDFFVFKTNNDFDFVFFFERLSFDFVIFNHIFNNISFSKFLINLYKMRLSNNSLFAVLSHYDFLFTPVSLFKSLDFYNYNNFSFVPLMHQNTEKELIFFYETFWNLFYKFEKVLGWSPFMSWHKQDFSMWLSFAKGKEFSSTLYPNSNAFAILNDKIHKDKVLRLDTFNYENVMYNGLFFIDIFFFFFSFFFFNFFQEYLDFFFDFIFSDNISEKILKDRIIMLTSFINDFFSFFSFIYDINVFSFLYDAISLFFFPGG
jgi:hypothetical protein